MKYVKLFEDFSSQEDLTEEQIEWLDRCTSGSWKLNQSTGLIDVDGGFYCGHQDLTDFKGVAFGHVSGSFSCYNNRLTSLEGAPQTVSHFYCSDNPASKKTLASIFALMKKGKSYQQALEKCWSNMDNDDRILMYKDYRSLTPEEIRRYDALTTVNRIKNYL